MRKIRTVLAGAAVAALTLSIAPAVSAVASTPPERTNQAATADATRPALEPKVATKADKVKRLRNRKTGLCLSQAEGTPDAFTCNSGYTAQRWKVRIWKDKTRRLENEFTNKCLTATKGHTEVVFRKCSGSDRQRWQLRSPWPSAAVQLRNKATGSTWANSNCLDFNNADRLRLVGCHKGNSEHIRHQTWTPKRLS